MAYFAKFLGISVYEEFNHEAYIVVVYLTGVKLGGLSCNVPII